MLFDDIEAENYVTKSADSDGYSDDPDQIDDEIKDAAIEESVA